MAMVLKYKTDVSVYLNVLGLVPTPSKSSPGSAAMGTIVFKYRTSELDKRMKKEMKKENVKICEA